jgi:hypothetical protein
MSEKACTPQIRAGRSAKAKQFLAAAGLIEDSASGDVADAYVT